MCKLKVFTIIVIFTIQKITKKLRTINFLNENNIVNDEVGIR